MSSDDHDRQRGRLAHAAESRLVQDIDSLIMDRRLAQSDAGHRIALELDASAGLSLPALPDMAQLGQSKAVAFASPEQLEALRSLDPNDMVDESGKLNRLLKIGWLSVE